jgi:hypothetical protein
MSVFVILLPVIWRGMKTTELIERLEHLDQSSLPEINKCLQAFQLVSCFLQEQGSRPVDAAFKASLRASVDAFYRRAAESVAYEGRQHLEACS